MITLDPLLLSRLKICLGRPAAIFDVSVSVSLVSDRSTRSGISPINPKGGEVTGELTPDGHLGTKTSCSGQARH